MLPKPLQERHIIFEVPGAGIEIDLQALKAVAGGAPLVEAAGDRGVAALRPVEGVGADHQPHLLGRQMRGLRPERDVVRRAAVADLAVEQIDNLRAAELGRRRHSGPQPEGVVVARIDSVAVRAPAGDKRERRGEDAKPYQ